MPEQLEERVAFLEVEVARLKNKIENDLSAKPYSDTNLLVQKQLKAAMLLQSWIDDEDVEEQQETGQYLINALDEDRLSERKLFPLELKGVTW